MCQTVQVQQIPTDVKSFNFKAVFDHTRIVLIYLIALTVVNHENEIILDPLRYFFICFTGDTFIISTITSLKFDS